MECEDSHSQVPQAALEPQTSDTKGAPSPAVTVPRGPYSVFTLPEKWTIVVIAAVGGMFSTLTANIYLPAIPAISSAFHKSIELINLTVTMYMVFQGLSPMIWGTLGDRLGRRPIFVSCLLILSLSCVGIALTPTNDYWLLMVLRCLQAAGSASTIALGAGIIGDISEPSERGGFFGLYSVGPMVGPCIGPVIGGVLSDKLGWRSIFWFLCIATAVCFIFMVILLPETLRSLVGNGSYLPSPIYRPLFPFIGRGRVGTSSTDKPGVKPFQNPLRLLINPDILLLLVSNGLVCAVFYGITASISVLFLNSYPFLTQTDIGLCFIAIGGGNILGSILIGWFMNREYHTIKRKMLQKAEREPESGIRPEDVTKEDNFPIELARLRTVPIYYAGFSACTIGYGWSVQAKVNLAVPLTLQFIIGYCTISIMNTTQTLLVDLFPTNGSSITACNNIVRCLLGAGLVAIIDIILKALGIGWTYVLLGGIIALMAPSIIISIRIGPICRAKRRAKCN